MKNTDKLYELRFSISRDPVMASCVVAALTGLGAKISEIVDYEDLKQRYLSLFFDNDLLSSEFCSRFKALKIKGVKIIRKTCFKDDWQSRWKKGWKPFPLTPKIHVIPCFIENAKCPRGKIPLYLDTTAAFGTGLHETTRFSAQLIESCQGKFKSILDVGTGSGILLAVALLSGAKYSEAFDIDSEAVNVAKENLKVNHLTCDVLKTCDVKMYKIRQSFDLVAANLITHDLVAFKDNIIACVSPGGFLIISGISLEKMPLVTANYNDAAGLKCLKVRKGKDWSAFLFKKSLM